MRVPSHWDLDYDVVVAGYGYAGAMAAMTAHDAGARVALFEKMAHPGGNSILSGGACLVGTEARASALPLGRKERFEAALAGFFIHPNSVIANLDDDVAGVALRPCPVRQVQSPRGNLDRPAPGQGIDRI